MKSEKVNMIIGRWSVGRTAYYQPFMVCRLNQGKRILQNLQMMERGRKPTKKSPRRKITMHKIDFITFKK